MAIAAVRLLLPGGLRVNGGAQYAPGEVAAFAPAFAEELLSLGLAQHAPAPSPPTKDVPAPTANKMVGHPPAKKGAV